MTVKELIQQLQRLPQNMPVVHNISQSRDHDNMRRVTKAEVGPGKRFVVLQGEIVSTKIVPGGLGKPDHYNRPKRPRL